MNRLWDINILGTKYVLIEKPMEDEPKLTDNLGFTDYTTKTIVIDKDIVNNKDANSMDDLNWVRKKVIRHEIIHAFFIESGMREWCDDENLVDFIAYQLPKMVAVMNKIGALDKG